MKNHFFPIILLLIICIFIIVNTIHSNINKQLNLDNHKTVVDSIHVKQLLEKQKYINKTGLKTQLKYYSILAEFYESESDFEKATSYKEKFDKIKKEFKNENLNEKKDLLEEKYNYLVKKDKLKQIHKYQEYSKIRNNGIILMFRIIAILLSCLFVYIFIRILFFSIYNKKDIRSVVKLLIEDNKLIKLLKENVFIKDDFTMKLQTIEYYHSITNEINTLKTKINKISEISDDFDSNQVAIFVHDFKNPLAVLYNYIQYIEEDLLAKGRNSNGLDKKIIDSIRKMIKSIETFLDYSRFKNPKENNIDLIEVFKNVLLNYSNDICDVTFNTQLEELIIKGDKSLFEKIFDQLIENSIESVIDKKAKVEIILTEKKEIFEIIFKDNGAEFSDELKEHFFNPFISTKPFHLGVGLTMAKHCLSIYDCKLDLIDNNSNGEKLLITIKK